MNQRIFKLWAGLSLIVIGILGWGIPHRAFAEEPLRCPQPRFTQKAPDNFYNLVNPLEATPENLKKGKILYQTRAKPMPCKHCHGVKGNGRGSMARGFDPPPRDFTCAKTVKGVPIVLDHKKWFSGDRNAFLQGVERRADLANHSLYSPVG